MRFLRQSLVGLFLVSLTLGLLVYAGSLVKGAVDARLSQEARTPVARERVFSVNVVPVVLETVAPELTAFGEVQSRRTLELRASTGGTLIDLAPEFVEGGHVTKGQMLARIDPTTAQAALARVNADLRDAEAEVTEAARALELAQDALEAARNQADLQERAYQRLSDLRDRGVGSVSGVESAELSLASARQSVLSSRQSLAQAEARVNQAATQLERQKIAVAEAERDLADTEIRAGFSGTLSGVSLVEGRLVSANEQLAQLIDADALEVAFRVSTQQYARLLNDAGNLRQSPVAVSLDVFGTDLTTTGILSRDSAAVGEGVTGRLVFASLDQARGFKPGDFVTVAIKEPELPRVARLPASAVNAANEVLVIGAEDRLETASVTLLRRQGDDVLVRANALDGRQVVAERSPLLGAGIKVRALQAGVVAAPPPAPDLVELTQERRAKLIAFVEGNTRMPAEAKQRILAQLEQPKVPADMVQRIESRMGD
ncbi:efflux RND transporter periplasmic adaptor subunit [Pseudoprimorskyibacter insulae]|uniref:Toluene efflux pump periplasmic linker protein TtgD n=1 Tax=Pseudoprimorskyibacter insulae TaxID=1695997 RepID=A0A2R8ANE3_9RHOB|nr:HlyD family efflux transporter periplasmic adaptor subunit [Pseudoprimorskyibacter insulae]SPF77563.1 Toluene efflux pump periplasmic linker protein TtgD [Pseudoprimorskyibacter insulae]